MPYLSVIIPAFNEESLIRPTFDEVDKALKKFGHTCEIILVDDGSADDTAKHMLALSQEYEHAKFFKNEVNKGLGGACKLGIANATGEFVMMVPGDNAHPGATLSPIFAVVGNADIVLTRWINPSGRSFLRRIISRTFTEIVNTIFRLDVPYYNGIVVYRREHITGIDIVTDGHAYQAEAIIKLLRQGKTFVSVGTEIWETEKRKNNAFRIKNIISVFSTIIYLWRVTRN